MTSVTEWGETGRGDEIGLGGGESDSWGDKAIVVLEGPECLWDRIKLSTASKKDSGTSSEG